MKTQGASVYGAMALLVVAIQPERIFAVDPPATIVVDTASFLHDLPQHDIWIDGGSGFGAGRGGPRAGLQGQRETAKDVPPTGRRGGPAPGSGPAAPSNLPSSDSLFNRCGIVLHSEANLYCVKDVPEAGTYHLFVRSQGNGKGSVRVSVNGKLTNENFGITSELTLAHGGAFALDTGPAEILITRIEQGPVLTPSS